MLGEDAVAQVALVEDLVAQGVDDLALGVEHLVVLEDVLADLAVLLLDGGLRPLDGLGDHPRLEGHVVGEGLAHHPVDGTGGEQAHEVVLERQVEPALAGVTLTAGAAAQLVVDPARLVALGAQDVQPAERPDLDALGLRVGLVHLLELDQQGLALGGVEVDALGPHVAQGQALGVAAEEDVDASTGHVGGHGDRAEAAGLGDDLGLSGVLLGVEHLVGDAALVEQAGELLGLLHRDRADEHGLARLVALGDVVDDRAELAVLALVDQVALVEPGVVPVRRDGHDLEVVGGGELGGLGEGRSGHPGRASRTCGSSSGG